MPIYLYQVSRSIGDVYLKKPEFNRDPMFIQYGYPIPLKRAVMSAEPSILIRKIRPEDLFLIFASDGLWDQLTDDEAKDIVLKNPRIVSIDPSYSIRFFNFWKQYVPSSILLSVKWMQALMITRLSLK